MFFDRPERTEYRYPRPQKMRGDVTVCVAAIGDNGQMLFLAADRMISGLSKYESPNPKVSQLTSSIALMWSSDDVGFQTIIHNRIQAEINRRITEDPNKWVAVEEVAILYREQYNRLRREEIDSTILQPFYPDMASFLKDQPNQSRKFVEQLLTRIRSYAPAVLSALIVGMDQVGPSPETKSHAHIYKFENYGGKPSISCEDTTGYATIGSGSPHAESELQKSGHGPAHRADKTLLVGYLAKKRGEAAPGVGTATDLYWFRPREGIPYALERVGLDIRDFLDTEYEKLQTAERRATAKLEPRLAQYVQSRGKPTLSAGDQGAPSSIPTAPSTPPTMASGESAVPDPPIEG